MNRRFPASTRASKLVLLATKGSVHNTNIENDDPLFTNQTNCSSEIYTSHLIASTLNNSYSNDIPMKENAFQDLEVLNATVSHEPAYSEHQRMLLQPVCTAIENDVQLLAGESDCSSETNACSLIASNLYKSFSDDLSVKENVGQELDNLNAKKNHEPTRLVRQRKPLQPLCIYSSSDDADFGRSSSDDYIVGTEESSDSSSGDSKVKAKGKQKNAPVSREIITTIETTAPDLNKVIQDTNINLTIVEENRQEEAGCSFWYNMGMTTDGKKKKLRKSIKERRDERIERLVRRNNGKDYVTKSGKVVHARKFQHLPECRYRCKYRISDDLRKQFFDEYWSLGSYDKRALFMEKCIEVNKKQTAKCSPKKKRAYSNKYYLYLKDNPKIHVCKRCLLLTFDESTRFLQTVCEKIQKHGRIIPQKHRSGKLKISDERLEEIKSHIMEFPSIESHYGRSKTTKKFLNSELTLQKIYDLYKERTENPVSKTIYSKVFRALNLSFKKPSVDTCSKCDTLKMKLRFTIGQEATDLENQLKEHQMQVQIAYDQKRSDKELSKNSEELVVITFDLEQCLPTPYLKTNVSFYKRQLWTYNLTIHDLNTDKAFCYMWPENNGGRGANDIASCLFHFIQQNLPRLYPKCKHLIMYSDSCSGQNKNSIVTVMLMLAAKWSPQLEKIEHKFLIPGHTHMEVDSDHALIERKKKRTTMDIHLPRDWYQLVRSAASKSTKFTVVEMKQTMFYDFGKFGKEQLTIKKTNQENIKFVWGNVRCIKYEKNLFPQFMYKEEFANDYMYMDYTKRTKVYDSITIDNVKGCYQSQIPISTEKKKDLLSLLPFIHESAHEFYRNLISKADVRDTAVNNDSDDE